MKKIISILSLLLCLTLISCSTRQEKIYEVLEGIDVSIEYTAFHAMVSNLSAPSLYTEQYPNEYLSVSAFGKAGVPHILNYVMEKPLNTLNAAFFICCCYDILGLDSWLTEEPLRNIEAHILALQAYIE